MAEYEHKDEKDLRIAKLEKEIKFVREASYVNGIDIVCSNCEINNIEKIDDYLDILNSLGA